MNYNKGYRAKTTLDLIYIHSSLSISQTIDLFQRPRRSVLSVSISFGHVDRDQRRISLLEVVLHEHPTADGVHTIVRRTIGKYSVQ